MFLSLFEERDKKITHLIKLGDCIGRSLRENVVLFSIDSANDIVNYLTESNAVITGNYTISDDVILSNIEVQSADVFQNEATFDGVVNEKIHQFVENIHFGTYSNADDSFDDILALWENRIKLGSIQEKLAVKAAKLGDVERIMESEEVGRFLELRPQLVEFLSENFDEISTVPEIKNATLLSNTVSKAFNFPKLSLDQLQEDGAYILKDGTSDSIYEMICRQELVKRELIESKKDFDVIWATNSSIKELASMIFEEDASKIVPVLAEALKEVPYLAMASKKSLFNTFSNCLSRVDGVGVSDSDIQKFASHIFEIKKEIKDMFIQSINEKYGVNIQNLQEPMSFKSLVNTQIVIFESLSRLAPKGSVIKQTLSELAQSLKSKHGVEAIDLNEAVYDLFCSAGYVDSLTEATATSSKVNLKRVAKDLGDARDLITNLRDKVADAQYDSQETTSTANEVKAKNDAKGEAPAENKEEPAQPEVPGDETSKEEGEGSPEVPKAKTEDEAIEDLSSLENMVADIAAELGIKDEPAEKEGDEDE